METRDIATLLSALIVAIGWFVNGWLNRRNDIAQERRKYRIETYHSFVPVWALIEKNAAPFSDPGFLPLLKNCRQKFILYGTKNERKLMEEFIVAIENKDLLGANHALNKLVPSIPEGIRRELCIR